MPTLRFPRQGRYRILVERVAEDLEWYWRVRLGRLGRAYLLATCVLGLLTSAITVYALLTPLVTYEGFALSGYVAPTRYELRVAGYGVTYPFLDSLSTISTFTLAFAVAVGSVSVLGLVGVRRRWRTWVALAPASTASSALLVSLLYSVLRFASLDAIPTLRYTITAAGTAGRLLLDPPKATYSWTYYLPWRPVYFLVASNALLILTAVSVAILLMRPREVVRPVKPGRRISRQVGEVTHGS